MTADLRFVEADPAPSPAALLTAAADWIQEDPTRWGQIYYVDNGCRCALGAIALAGNGSDEDGDPHYVLGGMAASETLADYLVNELGVPRAGEYLGSVFWPAPVETVGEWNDTPGRTWMEVVAALRGAARQAEGADLCSLCKGRTRIESVQGYDVVCPDCHGAGDRS